MTRRLATLAHSTATRLALLLLLLIPTSCSQDQPPVAPGHVMTGTKSAPSASGPIIKDQGIITLASGVSLSSVLNANDLDLVTTLPMPAAGPYPATSYYLVETEDGSDFSLKSFNVNEVPWYSDHQIVWRDGDDILQPYRDDLTFDDANTRRSATEFLNQPAFAQVHLTEALAISQGAGTVIALLDTGLDPSHTIFQNPPLTYTLGGNYSVMPPTGGTLDAPTSLADDDGDGYPNDGVGHGTFVAGLIHKAAPQAAIRVYKVLDDEGRGTTFGLAKAIRAAALAGVNVINCSLGFTDLDGNQMVHHAIVQAVAQDIAVVASAGNTNSSTPQYPAAYEEVVSVSAVDYRDERYSYASFGETVDLTAPGVDVISAISSFWGTNEYAAVSGTSAAVPWVSSTIAILRSRPLDPTTAQGAIPIILESADEIEEVPGIPLGSGRLNIGTAAESGSPEWQ